MIAGTHLTEAFEPHSRLALTNAALKDLVRFSGHFTYRHCVSPDDMVLHMHDIVSRVEARWRETRVRIFGEQPTHGATPASLRMIVECGYRLGPRDASALNTFVWWVHGPSWIEEISSPHDVALLRDLLARWPEHEDAAAGASEP